MAQFTFKSRVNVVIALVIACFAAAYFLAIPRWNQYQASLVQLHNAQAQNAQLTQSLSEVQNFIDTFNSHTADRDLANLALPAKKPDTAGLLAGIAGLAQASGVNLKSLQIGSAAAGSKTPPANSIVTQLVTMNADSTYPEFKDFITRLQSHLRLIDIQTVTLKVDDTGQTDYVLNLKIYYQQ